MSKDISNVMEREEPLIVEQEGPVDKQNKSNFFVYIPCTYYRQGACKPVVSCASCDIYIRDMKERYIGGNPADS